MLSTSGALATGSCPTSRSDRPSRMPANHEPVRTAHRSTGAAAFVVPRPARTDVAAKKADQDRKARIAQMQREAKAAERRRTLLIVGVAVVAVLGDRRGRHLLDHHRRLPGARRRAELARRRGVRGVLRPDHHRHRQRRQRARRPRHRQARRDDGEVLDGARRRPVSTSSAPSTRTRQFYTADDRPAMENLVHNLEHGYTILWYDDTATEAQISELKAIAARPTSSPRREDKFIVSAWDPAYGALPGGQALRDVALVRGRQRRDQAVRPPPAVRRRVR